MENNQYTKRQKVLLFYNPYSGNGVFKNNLDKIIEKFQQEQLQIIPVRAAREHGLELALEQMEPSEYKQIIVAGGDGTINIIINAMMKYGIKLPLAIFPVGTANDFASYLKIPADIDSMVDVALHGKQEAIDLGKCNDRYFINVAALGNLVDVSQKTDPNLKNTLGKFAYYIKGASEIVKLKTLNMKLITPEKTYKEKMMFMMVMNGVTAGGFKNLSPQSSVQDGLLNVILFRKVAIPKIVPLFFKVIRGEHMEDKNILTFTTSQLRVESKDEIPTDVDGEHGEKLPLDFSVIRGGIEMIIPEDR